MAIPPLCTLSPSLSKNTPLAITGGTKRPYYRWKKPETFIQAKANMQPILLLICVDYRKLNSCSARDTFPLPRIEDALDALGQAGYFSALDLATGKLRWLKMTNIL